MSVRDNECTQGVEEIENSELRKIAEDTLDSLKYSFATVAADPKQKVEPNSLEYDFKEALKTFKSENLAVLTKNAQELVALPEVGRKAVFGRYGVLDKETFMAKGGFSKVSEFMDIKSPLKINKKLLGIKTNSLNVPMDVLKPVGDGLLIPNKLLPANWTDFESVKEKSSKDYENAYESDVFDETKLSDIWGRDFDDTMFDEEGAEDNDEFEEQAIFNSLSLYIKRVKCVDETNPELWGHDEIALAGVSIDEDGDTKKIKEKYIGGGFDDGDSKTYSPHWRYETFNINEGGNNWPKKYTLTYLLAEKDHGGLSTALNKLWSKIRKFVMAAIAKAVADGLAYWKIPKAIGAAIGAAVAWVIDKLFGWIIKSLKDDIFKAQVVACGIGSRSGRFYHKYWWQPRGVYRNYSKTYRSHFYGHGGHYYIDYYWKLS